MIQEYETENGVISIDLLAVTSAAPVVFGEKNWETMVTINGRGTPLGLKIGYKEFVDEWRRSRGQVDL